MTIKKGLRGRIVLSAVALAIAAAVSIGVLSKSHQQRERTKVLPQIYSKVKNLEVISATIIDAGTPHERVQIEIWNHSSQAVMAVDLVAGDSGVTKNGLTDEEHPVVVIEPYGTTKVEMPLGNIDAGVALVVSAVTYADGTEEGEPESLKFMHLTRARDKARIMAERDKEKGGSKP